MSRTFMVFWLLGGDFLLHMGTLYAKIQCARNHGTAVTAIGHNREWPMAVTAAPMLWAHCIFAVSDWTRDSRPMPVF